MALKFIKKVFSFGRKEAEETPPEDQPLAPLNLDALKEFAAEKPAEVSPSPLRGGSVGEADRGGVLDEAREVLSSPTPFEEAPRAADTTPSGPSDHLPIKGEGAAAPAIEPFPARPEIPTTPGEVPEPAPAEIPVTPEDVPAPSMPGEVPPGPGETPAPEQPEVPPETPAPSQPEPAPAPSPPDVPETPSVPTQPPTEVPPEQALATGPVQPAASAPVLTGKVTVGKAVEKAAEPPATVAAEARRTWFQRLRQGLSRSSRELSGSISGIFTKRKLDDDTLEELEDVLLRADLGMETALRVTDSLASSRYGRDVSDAEVRAIMAQEVEKVLAPVAMPLELDLSHKPHVILVVGVNGTGKTTTIGKLAAKLRQGGLSVMLAAGDTFRAAAIEQLKIWGERTGSPVVSSKLGADAAGLAWDAFEKAKAAGSDVLIIDTAGRLQNKAELMAELEKIARVLGKHDPEAPHTVLQTVDATTGQNALSQVEIFRNVAGVNGLVMTKLDGTARGGILVAIAAKHKLPVYFIGVGEQVEDLEPFSAGDFAKAIAGVG
ncbi:signal recognition particle-docking protein FtsY [Pseudaminobacter sp. 19-2017]|uniref:Signal recognition particle receptor FtsY n=1 Tax=Pseudaminobacter soli (ex Zhang et al. 2022) TaxID=2831468 RepID=A0A942DYY7_9HYPH|nr:signal recognition particle-docking protein FtsY [Pseudaminobacter soli]MBS3647951.1 signal recognition particle-docking protein FtsY [Pseudaminobacter soli]